MAFIDEYRRLDYIQSSSSQYIRCGITIPYDKERVVITCTPLSGSQFPVWGHYYGSWGWGTNILFISSNVFYWGGKSVGLSYETNKIYNFDFTSKELKCDGQVIATSTQTFINAETTLFFGNGNYGSWRVYSCQIYNDTELVRDFIPCERKTDGSVGLYDLVTDTFFGNNGTGTFNKGNYLYNVSAIANPTGSGYFIGEGTYPQDINVSLSAIPNGGYDFVNWNLKGYTKLEYIESTGTQWINPSLELKKNNRYEFGINVASLNGILFGVNSSSYEVMLAYYNLNEHYLGGKFNYQLSLNTYYDFIFDLAYESNNLRLYINNTKIRDVNSNTNDYPFYLFASGDSSDQHGKLQNYKLYYFKAYNNGTLVRDFIPCIRHRDGAIGLLDLCELKFYANNGTGEFLGGNIL